MRRIRYFFGPDLLLHALVFTLCVVWGCGGGTSGTGVREITGQVTTLDGAPVADVQITAVGTDGPEIVLTSEDGEFLLEIPCDRKEVTLLVDAPNGQIELSSDVNRPEAGQGIGTSSVVASGVVVSVSPNQTCEKE